MSMTIQKLIIDSHKTSIAKGWWENPDRNIGELLALIHSEISEALEVYREQRKFGQKTTVNQKDSPLNLQMQ